MPIHDWTRVGPEIAHDFHLGWVVHLSGALNTGILPPAHYALIEQHAGYELQALLAQAPAPGVRGKRRSIAVRRTGGHQLIALVELLSPSNVTLAERDAASRKIEAALEAGVHAVVVDLVPTDGESPTLTSYLASRKVAFLQHLVIGDSLPDVQLFLTPEHPVNLPLGPTYEATTRGMAAFWRDVLEGRRPAPGKA